jgi:hypothetical protein
MSPDYIGHKFAQARRALMIPPADTEAKCLAIAFNYRGQALNGVTPQAFDNALMRSHVEKVLALMSGEGSLPNWAEVMTVDEKRAFAKAVDELADWGLREFYLRRPSR